MYALVAEADQATQQHRIPSPTIAAHHVPPPRSAQTGHSIRDGGAGVLVPFETLWDVKDVAAHLKCSESWVYKHAEKGTLPSVRYGGLLRFHPQAIRLHGNRPAA